MQRGQEDDWQWLEALPLMLHLDLPKSPLPVVVVHAGLVPGPGEGLQMLKVWKQQDGGVTLHVELFVSRKKVKACQNFAMFVMYSVLHLHCISVFNQESRPSRPSLA